MTRLNQKPAPADLYADAIEGKRAKLAKQFDRPLLRALIADRAKFLMAQVHAAGATHMSMFHADIHKNGINFRGSTPAPCGFSLVAHAAAFPHLFSATELFPHFSALIDLAQFKLMGREAFIEIHAQKIIRNLAAQEACKIDQGSAEPPPALAALAERKALDSTSSPAPHPHGAASKPRSL